MPAAIHQSMSYLLARICRAQRGKVQQALAPLELYPGQEMLLVQLWQKDGLTQAELAAHMGVQPATLTRMVDRLSQNGLIERRPDPDDKRLARVFLLDEGRFLRGSVEALWEDLDGQIFAGMALAERLLLRRLLAQMAENLADTLCSTVSV